jgi:hypothetical protein
MHAPETASLCTSAPDSRLSTTGESSDGRDQAPSSPWRDPESKLYTVVMSGTGNPAKASPMNDASVDLRTVFQAKTLHELSLLAVQYRDGHKIDAGEWNWPRIYHRGSDIGYITYSGRIIASGSNSIGIKILYDPKIES